MGSVITALGSVVKVLECQTCNKYVLNDCSLRAQCFDHCCDLEIITQPIDLQSSDSDLEVDIENCCHVSHKA